MKYYVVITGKQENKGGVDLYQIAVINGDSYAVHDIQTLDVVSLPAYIVNTSTIPLNFAITPKGDIEDCFGSFDRLAKSQAIAVAKAVKKDKTEGYLVLKLPLGVSNNVMFVTSKEIVNTANSLGANGFAVQNLIVRNNAVNSYPNNELPIYNLAEEPKQVAPEKKAEKVAKPVRKAEKVSEVKKPQSKKLNIDKSLYDSQQIRQIKMAEKAQTGLSKVIQNPELSAKQMHIIWRSKLRGIKAEIFAKKCYTVPVMKFYADHLFTDTRIKSYRDALAHPELKTKELLIIDKFICNDLDYSEALEHIGDAKAMQDILNSKLKAKKYEKAAKNFTPERQAVMNEYYVNCLETSLQMEAQFNRGY